MKNRARLAQSICFVMVVAFVFCSCTGRSERTFSVDAAATLKDRKHMAVTLDIEFEKKEGVAEAQKKKQKIKYAVSLIFREYSTHQITNMSNSTLNATAEAILETVIDSPFKDIKISVLSIDDKKISRGH